MALPGHSPPPPYNGPGSPTRLLNGRIETSLPPMYGPPRSMPPPSPQNFRFPLPPIPTPSPSLPPTNDGRVAAPYKRPGSSMSISSMLGGEPEKPTQDSYQNLNSRGSSRQGSISAPLSNSFAAMSPPQQHSKLGLGEYTYKPRSQTPDRIDSSLNTSGTRQRSSSSGTPLQRSVPFIEPHVRSASTIPAARYLEQSPSLGFNSINTGRSEQEERVRRTSLSGILQRPNSQPQPDQNLGQHPDPFRPNTSVAPPPDKHTVPDHVGLDPFQRNGVSTIYDTKPPGSNSIGRTNGPQMSPTRVLSTPSSPDSRRLNANGTQGRTLASILNGPPSQPSEFPNVAAQIMARQDSAQSQSDRSAFGDRGKFRQYSPFATSVVNQSQSSTGASVDEQGRKGSDELSQHRVLIGLAAESRRGRYSPRPQVVQGAQAQTPVPDVGVKTEHGRVFSGLGGGIGTTPTLANSTLKRDDGRPPLSEDDLTKVSRSTSGANKRSRKHNDEELVGEPEAANGSKMSGGRANKKSKYQHSYKVELEELTNQGAQRRSTPLTGFNPARNMSTPLNTGLNNTSNVYTSQHQRPSEPVSTFKAKQSIKVASVFNMASRASRRHLGNFRYRPDVSPSDHKTPSSQRFDISIRPNLLPSFSASDHVNCTYTIHVPRIWLQDRERGLICAERYLWGSGIYTDDSDPVAASIHAGFLKASFGDAVDTNLLSSVIQDQNPSIEWPKDLMIPDQPMEIEQGKDLNITLVVLPLLERYHGSARFGIKSRSWPQELEKVQHDGVSFGVLKVEFVNIGREEMRMGRTGASRRQRLRMDLEARERGLQIQKDRIEKAKQKQLNQIKLRKASTTNKDMRSVPMSLPVPSTNNSKNYIARQFVPAVA